MIRCEAGCMYWSELIAKSARGRIVALCLNPKSPHYQQYTGARNGCDEGEIGPSIDDPDPSR